MNKVEVFVEVEEKIKELETVEKVLYKAIEKEKLENVSFNLIIVDNDYIHELNKTYQTNKLQYDNIINMLNNYKQQYGIKEKELYQLIDEKKKIDGQLTLEGLQEALKSHISQKYAKPKQQLINDFLSSKVSLNEFTEKFKQLNQNYHYYSIIKDKLNLFK